MNEEANLSNWNESIMPGGGGGGGGRGGGRCR